MSPALPKPSDARHRRGPSDRILPAEGNPEPAPDMPDGNWSEETREWWARIFASPMSCAWIESDVDAAVRLARIREAIIAHPEKAALHAAASALEDRLGLSPRARRALNWKIQATPEAPAAVQRIRVVDARSEIRAV